MDKPVIIVSAINIFEGGALTVLKECLNALNNNFSNEYHIEVFVYQKSLFNNDHFNNIKFNELPKSRKSWFYRLFYEYFFFNRVSKEIKPILWLSLHDTTPILQTGIKQCVYCHNPSIFYNSSLSDFFYDKTHVLFSLFYKFLYQINISKNDFVIVQQDWIRTKFSNLFKIPLSKILVAYPDSGEVSPANCEVFCPVKATFIYPAFPRIFKNYEIIINAAQILIDQGITDFEIKFTLSGVENSYAKKIAKLSKSIPQIIFVGLMQRTMLLREYTNTTALIFPSKLETWGLPISEFKTLNKTILLADLEYAHETLGTYDKACFFNSEDAKDLATKMASLILNGPHTVWQNTTQQAPEYPFTTSWKEMLHLVLSH
ncbi:glycosyltransferase [Dyadobacter sp. LHD-138]|uniref:glycosyltransferase n=1 Tax=Dyadobacter sp. LHD-138 TaxID=3071413 RepID=UPI0027DF73CC|nr:glycosyltransferase [Dyadobacter sp. LHD-138]MDQ6481887.1 glycosyltransferase [Dyadobacter sp. LHD-138]